PRAARAEAWPGPFPGSTGTEEGRRALEGVSRPAAGESPRRVRVPLRFLALRRGLRGARKRRCGAERLGARGGSPAASRFDDDLGLRAAAPGGVRRSRPAALGGAAPRHFVAADLRLLHARADGARLCRKADRALAARRRS